MAFYICKLTNSSGHESPESKITCTSGHNVTREATVITSDTDFFKQKGFATGLIAFCQLVHGRYPYSGQPQGIKIIRNNSMNAQSDGAGMLSAQADGDVTVARISVEQE